MLEQLFNSIIIDSMKTLKQQHIKRVQETRNSMIIAPKEIEGKSLAIGIELIKDSKSTGGKKWNYAHVTVNTETGTKSYGSRYENFEEALESHIINITGGKRF